MTQEDMYENLQKMIDGYSLRPAKRRELGLSLQSELSKLKALLNDRLLNGGMVSHGAKHSMQPTLKHDTV